MRPVHAIWAARKLNLKYAKWLEYKQVKKNYNRGVKIIAGKATLDLINKEIDRLWELREKTLK